MKGTINCSSLIRAFWINLNDSPWLLYFSVHCGAKESSLFVQYFWRPKACHHIDLGRIGQSIFNNLCSITQTLPKYLRLIELWSKRTVFCQNGKWMSWEDDFFCHCDLKSSVFYCLKHVVFTEGGWLQNKIFSVFKYIHINI